jgi:hypothetical protein
MAHPLIQTSRFCAAAMLFHSTNFGQFETKWQFMARASVAEANRCRLDAVHENHPNARERVVVELAVRRLCQLLPGEFLLCERRPAVVQKVDGHGGGREQVACDRADCRQGRRSVRDVSSFPGAIAAGCAVTERLYVALSCQGFSGPVSGRVRVVPVGCAYRQPPGPFLRRSGEPRSAVNSTVHILLRIATEGDHRSRRDRGQTRGASALARATDLDGPVTARHAVLGCSPTGERGRAHMLAPRTSDRRGSIRRCRPRARCLDACRPGPHNSPCTRSRRCRLRNATVQSAVDLVVIATA